MALLLLLAAILCFVLATFGVTIGDHGLIAPGLAFFAAAHLPLGDWISRP